MHADCGLCSRLLWHRFNLFPMVCGTQNVVHGQDRSNSTIQQAFLNLGVLERRSMRHTTQCMCPVCSSWQRISLTQRCPLRDFLYSVKGQKLAGETILQSLITPPNTTGLPGKPRAECMYLKSFWSKLSTLFLSSRIRTTLVEIYMIINIEIFMVYSNL